MTNGIQVFKNEKFGEVRTVEINGNIWFVGKDVASALGYTDLNHCILDHIEEDDRVNSKTQGQNALEFGQRGTWLINESGVYALIFGSKLESAKEFKHWVTSEVLPSIRKTGSYSVTSFTSEEMMKALTQNLTALTACVTSNNAQLQDHSERLEKIEKQLEEKKSQVAPDLPPKERIIALIRNHANKTKEDFAELYRQLYSDYSLRTHINPSVKAKNRNMTTITFIEKEGDINLLVSIAEKLFGLS